MPKENCRPIPMLCVACVLAHASPTIAAPVLRSADVKITVVSPTACEVTMTLAIDDAQEIDHRVAALEDSRIELVNVRGARQVGDLRTIGRTQSLVLQPNQPSYEIQYRVQVSGARAHRCPLWLPTVPTDGRSRAIHLQVDLPPASTPGRSMPAFSWTGTHGSASLGHLPAFVRIPYGSGGESAGWGIELIMDAVAVAVFVGATIIWVWRRRR